jgi:two-component system sensor histidine kinase HydH
MGFIHERLSVFGGTLWPRARPGGSAEPSDWRWSDEETVSVKRQTFNLRLWFAACSFGTIAVICGLGALWVSSFLTRSLLEREGEVSQEFLESIVTVDGPAMFRDDGTEPYVAKPELLDFAKHIMSMPDVLRVNIYANTHRVLWSTEKQLVGKIFPVNDELDDAFKGERVTEIGRLPDEKLEHVALGQKGHFIEAYIPIRADRGKGPVLGVVEFYKLPLALGAAIERAQRTVWIVAVAAALVLFLTLYWIVARGARLIEEQQQRLGHMEAFAAVGQMASAVAHSLRNPMSAIRSSAELWRTDQPSGRCEIADNVIREVDRMDVYVRDLLAYAKSENYQPQPVNPLRVVETILAKQRATIDRNHIEVETRADRAAVRDVMADAMLLEQALTSVVTNAVEAMPEGGKLAISIDSTGDDVRIEIADSGRGIPAELMKRVRESYFTTKARGLGLGLALATSIIERFQGRLDIGSTPDVGTRVSINLKPA